MTVCFAGEWCREHRGHWVHTHHPPLQHGNAHRPVHQSQAASLSTKQVQGVYFVNCCIFFWIYEHPECFLFRLFSDWCSHHSWDARFRGSRLVRINWSELKRMFFGLKYRIGFFCSFSVNKQLADKERVAAALENSSLLEVVNQCLSTRSHWAPTCSQSWCSRHVELSAWREQRMIFMMQ